LIGFSLDLKAEITQYMLNVSSPDCKAKSNLMIANKSFEMWQTSSSICERKTIANQSHIHKEIRAD